MSPQDTIISQNGPEIHLCISAVGDKFQLEGKSTHRKNYMSSSANTNKNTFQVNEEECDEMIAALENEKASWNVELKYLSRSWVKAVWRQKKRTKTSGKNTDTIYFEFRVFVIEMAYATFELAILYHENY